jgi:HEPN domain-containing protein
MSDIQPKEYNWEEIYRNALRQFMDIFVTPEVTRRQETGELPRPLDLRAAQIIFYPDGRKPEVRINSEVKAIGKMKLKAGASKNYGDPVYASELDGLEELTLTNEDDPDCGHATILHLGDNWLLAFDFIYNKGLANKHIETAIEFIDAAEFSFTRKHWSAFADNLFSAAELLAKATLLSGWADHAFREKTTHTAVHSRYNRFAHLGNVDPLHAKIYNKLSQLRYPARYLKNDFSLSEDDAQKLLEGLRSMFQEASILTRAFKG